jgi:hypothetical protein
MRRHRRWAPDGRENPRFTASGPILPRSLHLPVAVTEGRLTENLNEIGARFWT